MAINHQGGNIQPGLDLEEHDGANNAKRVNVVAGGVGQATVTPLQAWPDPKTYIGLVTTTVGNTVNSAVIGNITLSDPKTGIGLVTIFGGLVGINGNLTLSDPKTYIGLVTVTQASSVRSIAGNVTLDAGSKTQIVGNVTLSDAKTNIGLVTLTGGTAWTDPKTYIGLVTITGSLAPASGNVTLDPGSKTGIVGNVTLSDSKGFIGLVSVGGGILNTITAVTDITNPIAVKGNLTLSDSKGFLGLVTVGNTVNTAVIGNLTLSDAKTNIGLVTLTGGTAWTDPKTYIGLVTITGSLAAASGNVTLDAGSKTGIVGNVTLSDSKAGIGLVSVFGGSIGIIGNVTLSDAKTNIGLVTLSGGTAWTDPKTYIGLVTITGSLAAASGNVTLDPGSKTGIVGNVTLTDSKGFIGLVSIGGGILNTITAVTDITNPVAIKGNLTLSDSKTFIGLVSVGGGILNTITAVTDITNPVAIKGNLTLSDAKTNIGLVTLTGGTAWTDPKTYIGLVTITGSLAAASGNVTLDPGSKTGIVGNLTLSDSKGFIGLVSIGGGILNTITAVTDITNPVAIKGNVTISDSKTYIGLVTATVGNTVNTAVLGNVTLSDSKAFIGLVTVGGGTVKIQDGSGIATNAAGSGFLKTTDEPTQIFYDPFDAALDTTNMWTSTTGSAGVAASVSAGVLTMGTGTTANGYSKLISIPTFKPTIPGWVVYSDAIALPDGAAPTANSYRYWGSGTTPATPTVATPVTDGYGFELNTDGKLRAVVYAGGTRTVIADLSSSGTNTQPLNASYHRYIVQVRTDKTFFYIDTIDNVGLVATTSFNSSQAQILPKLFLCIGNSSPPVSNTQIQCTGAVVSDTGKNATQISDGTYPWRRASVSSAGAMLVSLGGGNVTLDPGSKTGIVGNVTLSDAKTFIGLVTVGNTVNTAVIGNVTLSDSKGFIGLVTVGGGILNTITAVTDITNPVALKGNLTLSDSKTNIGLVTLTGGTAWTDPKTYIGLVTITGSLAAASGNVTLDAGSKTQIVGNLTLSDSKGFIGLVTVGNTVNTAVIGNVTLSDAKTFIGLVTTQAADPKGYIGLVTVTQASLIRSLAGNVTLDAGSKTGIVGNITITDSKGYIGLVTLGGGTAWTDPKTYIGLVTVGHTVTSTIIGNLTLTDAKTYVGLVTATLGIGTQFIGLVTTVPTFISGYTSLATVISATGPATIVVPPTGQKIFIKNMHITSLGRSELSAWKVNSSATAANVPWTSLSTTSGFAEFWGDNGSQWGLADDGLTFALNGAATVGIMVNVRFA